MTFLSFPRRFAARTAKLNGTLILFAICDHLAPRPNLQVTLLQISTISGIRW